MTFDPILSAPLAVQIHLSVAIVGVLLGPVAIYRQRRDLLHKAVGRVWVLAMAVLAISGFFIPAQVLPIIGFFGPIHLLSVWTLISLVWGIRAILRRDVARHRATMRGLYWQALGIAGLFTFLPGRRMNAMIFGDAPWLGFWLVGAVGFGALVWLLRGRLARGGLAPRTGLREG